MKKVYRSNDKDIQFKYKRMGLKIHNWLFNTKHEKIEYEDSAESESGKQNGLVYTLDGKDSYHVEGKSTSINPQDVEDSYYYYIHKSYGMTNLKSYCICTAKPQEDTYKHVDHNFTFKLPVIYPQNFDGAKVLSNLKDKVEAQEELTDDDQAKLVFLTDMNIDLPIKKLMIEKGYIITHANIPDDDKKDLLACHIQELNRFFESDEISEMISQLEKLKREL